MLGLVIYAACALVWIGATVMDCFRGGPWRGDLAVALLFVVLGYLHRSRMGGRRWEAKQRYLTISGSIVIRCADRCEPAEILPLIGRKALICAVDIEGDGRPTITLGPCQEPTFIPGPKYVDRA